MARLRTLPSRLGTISQMRVAPAPKRADDVYSTPQYRAWREAVISRAGGICQGQTCRRQERRMFADHITEIKDGGDPFDPANGQCLCGRCHTLKTNAARAARHAPPSGRSDRG